MNAVDMLKYGQLTVLRALDGFPESAWETPGACGIWSVKEIIANLASYEQMLVDVLTTFLGGGPTPYLTRFTEQRDQFNDTEVALRKEKTMREVLDELNETHTHVMSLVYCEELESNRCATPFCTQNIQVKGVGLMRIRSVLT